MDFIGISWATPFLLITIYGVLRYWAKHDKQSTDGINWSPAESVAVTLAIYFGGQTIGALMVYALPALLGWDQQQISVWVETNAYAQFLLILTIEAVTLGLLWFFIKKRRSSFRALGLRRPKLSDFGYVAVAYCLYFLTYVFILSVIQVVWTGLDTEQAQQIGFKGASGLSLVFVFMSLVVLPPVVEEILMRGFLYGGLKKGLGIAKAAIITSLLFAVAHLQFGNGAPLLWIAAIDTFLLSFILIYLREKTGGLAAPIGLHALKNGVAFASIFVFNIV